MRIVYPNRDRALRHIKRTRAVFQYGRFPQRVILGMPCCDPGFLTLGREHTTSCPGETWKKLDAIRIA